MVFRWRVLPRSGQHLTCPRSVLPQPNTWPRLSDARAKSGPHETHWMWACSRRVTFTGDTCMIVTKIGEIRHIVQNM